MSFTRKPAGAPGSTGGQFASKGFPPPTIVLTHSLNDLLIPTKDDWAHARHIVRAEVQWRDDAAGLKWNELDAIIEADRELLAYEDDVAARRASTSSAMRAFEAGIAHPADVWYDEQWETPGMYGEEATRAQLASTQRMLEQFNNGELKPSQIVGTGYKNARKVATDYLNDRIQGFEDAIRTNGRSYRNAPDAFLPEYKTLN